MPPMVPEHRRLVRPKAPVPPRASAVFVQAALAVSVQVCLASTASQASLAVLAARIGGGGAGDNGAVAEADEALASALAVIADGMGAANGAAGADGPA